MRILLDTNILIHREGAYVSKRNIGDVFGWMNRLGYQKSGGGLTEGDCIFRAWYSLNTSAPSAAANTFGARGAKAAMSSISAKFVATKRDSRQRP